MKMPPSLSKPSELSSAQALVARAVLLADDARRAAMVAHDLATLSTLLGDALVYTHSTGRRESKEQYLGSLKNGRVRYLALERFEARVDVYGDAAVMHGSSSIRALTQGELKYVGNLFQSVWVLGEPGWQMVAWTSVNHADVLPPHGTVETTPEKAPIGALP